MIEGQEMSIINRRGLAIFFVRLPSSIPLSTRRFNWNMKLVNYIIVNISPVRFFFSSQFVAFGEVVKCERKKSNGKEKRGWSELKKKQMKESKEKLLFVHKFLACLHSFVCVRYSDCCDYLLIFTLFTCSDQRMVAAISRTGERAEQSTNMQTKQEPASKYIGSNPLDIKSLMPAFFFYLCCHSFLCAELFYIYKSSYNQRLSSLILYQGDIISNDIDFHRLMRKKYIWKQNKYFRIECIHTTQINMI